MILFVFHKKNNDGLLSVHEFTVMNLAQLEESCVTVLTQEDF